MNYILSRSVKANEMLRDVQLSCFGVENAAKIWDGVLEKRARDAKKKIETKAKKTKKPPQLKWRSYRTQGFRIREC